MVEFEIRLKDQDYCVNVSQGSSWFGSKGWGEVELEVGVGSRCLNVS